LAAGFCPKNLVFAQKIMVLTLLDLGGTQHPMAPLACRPMHLCKTVICCVYLAWLQLWTVSTSAVAVAGYSGRALLTSLYAPSHHRAKHTNPPQTTELQGLLIHHDPWTGDDGINESEASRDGAPAESGASITPTQRHKTPRQCRCCCCRTDRLRHSTDVTASVRGLPAGAATNTTHTHTGAYIKRFKAAK